MILTLNIIQVLFNIYSLLVHSFFPSYKWSHAAYWRLSMLNIMVKSFIYVVSYSGILFFYFFLTSKSLCLLVSKKTIIITPWIYHSFFFLSFFPSFLLLFFIFLSFFLSFFLTHQNVAEGDHQDGVNSLHALRAAPYPPDVCQPLAFPSGWISKTSNKDFPERLDSMFQSTVCAVPWEFVFFVSY